MMVVLTRDICLRFDLQCRCPKQVEMGLGSTVVRAEEILRSVGFGAVPARYFSTGLKGGRRGVALWLGPLLSAAAAFMQCKLRPEALILASATIRAAWHGLAGVGVS